jgi:hypothetical protein
MTTPQPHDDQEFSTPELSPFHRHTRRIAALGFIVLILLGNFWAALAMVGAKIPEWFAPVSGITVMVVLLSGLLLTAFWISRLIKGL